MNTINSFLSNNNTVCSLIFCIELIEKGAIASHIHVIKFFNLPNSIKWIVTACHLWARDIILDFVLAISFNCCGHDLTIIKKSHTFSNSLWVTVVTHFTTKTIYYFLSFMSYLINKLKPHILFISKKMCVFLLCTQKKIVSQCLRSCLKVAQTCFHNSLSYLMPMPHFIPMLHSILEPSRLVRNLPPHKGRTDKKPFVMLSRFWLLKEVRVNLLKQRRIIVKNLFQVRLNEVVKICKKWYLLM